ncbi:MAG: DUF2249 domain-containing protein [Gammaproteobacteria bacterium]|nr:DUF2249 domain-containing protein [Gammaproteobacteria bacterium]
MTAREIRLDVSGLEPCEPLERTLAAAEALGPGEYLRVLHRREPLPLFPLLEQLGCAWHCRPGTETAYEVLVWRRGDEVAEAATAEA